MARLPKAITPHKAAPVQLVKLWRKQGYNFYRTADKLKINVGHVYNLIRYGVKPKRLDLQRKLFLTKKKSDEELEQMRERRLAEREKIQKQIDEYFNRVLGGK